MKNINHKYFFAENESSGFDAGGKAVSDAISIIKKRGYLPIIIRTLSFNSINNKFGTKLKKILVILELFYKLFKLPKNSEIVLNYPTRINPGRATFWVFSNFKLKKFRFIFIVHDLKDLQKNENEKGGDKTLIKLLVRDGNSKIIIHTRQMRSYLVDLGVQESQIEILKVFDYLLPGRNKVRKNISKKSKEIIIAGNLKEEKMKYLIEINQLKNITFNLYGNNISPVIKNYTNVNYWGSFKPEELINHLVGSFGLVWDSDRVDKLVGKKGEYQKLNSPHKISLYLVAGLPIILSKEAGMAEFILENNLGLVIDGLHEIDQKINDLSEEEYEQICSNVSEIGEKIKDGYFLTNALSKID
ncbi:hypothetical protein P7H76_02515 [Lactococcus lactis]|uniref:hypothetical protein n=1 Tax=Lactococcus lactis TaxID=1358 RepID=UPI002890D7D9|nr:hypothetical protein [Lactococcus lactis]MDT2886054.1 hypothetical protein [Lactococcus lactis]